MNWIIQLSDLNFGREERDAVSRVLESNWLTMGEETQRFEEEFAAYVGARHAIACASGTAALHLSMMALGIARGSAVVQPTVNFVAAANMTIICGAQPVFVDICAINEPTVHPGAINAALDRLAATGLEASRTAVIAMHYGGYPSRISEISEICRRRGVPLVEDACHAPGACVRTQDGDARMLGTFGDVGCFSFFSNKNIAVGEGGMVVTDRDDLATRMRLLRSHGMSTLTWDRHHGHASSYDVLMHGFNYRIDEIRSAIGRAQLVKLPEGNEKRRFLTAKYWERLDPLLSRGWHLPFLNFGSTSILNSACHLMAVVASDVEARTRVAEALRNAAIQTSQHYPHLCRFSAFRESSDVDMFPVSAWFCDRVLTLPLHPLMEVRHVTEVANIILAHA